MKMSHIFFFKLQRSIYIVLHDADIYYIVGTKISLHLFEYILQAIKSHKLNQNIILETKELLTTILCLFWKKQKYFVK